MKNKFYIGIGILAFLFLAYYIPVNVESGNNYIVQDSLLGIIIFHNLGILGIYILIGLGFILTGKFKIKII
ncbi:hypothetical protein COU54_05595 [Candidatus Pacearchaeota archaeon CG10_big_fil_rev_8_21_14_0_10_31_24]|nr:MAG: hypothetical protein COU54_05595 [Candidatus Pacearchaeota archaeon CG10_big_fil_rev_8_21_14_0_10_31_24]